MYDFPRPPLDRDLNPDELRGFHMALGQLISWSGQIAAQGAMLGATDPVHGIRLMQEKAAFTAGLCQALARSPLGTGNTLPARAQQGPSGPASPHYHRPVVDGRPGQHKRTGT